MNLGLYYSHWPFCMNFGNVDPRWIPSYTTHIDHSGWLLQYITHVDCPPPLHTDLVINCNSHIKGILSYCSSWMNATIYYSRWSWMIGDDESCHILHWLITLDESWHIKLILITLDAVHHILLTLIILDERCHSTLHIDHPGWILLTSITLDEF